MSQYYLEFFLFLVHLTKFLKVFEQRVDNTRLPVVVAERDDVTADVIAADADAIIFAFFSLPRQRQHVAQVGVVRAVVVLIIAVIVHDVVVFRL